MWLDGRHGCARACVCVLIEDAIIRWKADLQWEKQKINSISWLAALPPEPKSKYENTYIQRWSLPKNEEERERARQRLGAREWDNIYLYRTRFVYQFDHLISFPSTKIYWMTSFLSMCVCACEHIAMGLAITMRTRHKHAQSFSIEAFFLDFLLNLDGRLHSMWNFPRYHSDRLISSSTRSTHTYMRRVDISLSMFIVVQGLRPHAYGWWFHKCYIVSYIYARIGPSDQAH